MIPKIDLPIFDVTLPSTGKVIKCRPYLVKEEKLLLMAAESGEADDILNATKQIVQNCVLDEKFDVESTPLFDIDFIFVSIRAKSVGEKIDISFQCNAEVPSSEDPETSVYCRTTFSVPISLNDVEVIKDDALKNKIQLSDNLGVIMKYPTFSVPRQFGPRDNEIERSVKVIAGCIHEIFDKEQVYSTKDITFSQLCEFVDNLTKEQYAKLKHWTDNIPKIRVSVHAPCPKCGFMHNYISEDVLSFF
jgi:T4 bacteriophage base plate protein